MINKKAIGFYILALTAFLPVTNVNALPRPNTDVNGDGKADIVGFGPDNVIHASLSNGDGTFRSSIGSTPGFTKNLGWTNNNDFPRMLADVNGDGKADIVGFGADNVIHVSLSNGNGTFRTSIGSTPGFTKNLGWTNNNDFPRMLADINGDGKADIVGFGPDNVIHVSLSNGDGTFRTSIGSTPGFTKNLGWTNNNDFPRMLTDVNGDGKADIVGFYSDRIFISIGNGNGTFQIATSTFPGFTKNLGWTNNNDFPRILADVNGDGKADIVGFYSDRIFVSIGNGNGTFQIATSTFPGFTKNLGWTNNNDFPRMLADVNGDGKADIVGFGPDNVIHVSLSNGNGTFRTSIGSTPGFTKNYGWTNNNDFPRMVASGYSAISSSSGYYSELTSLTDNDWDIQTGDDNQFRPDSPFGGGDQRSKTDERIRQIYTDVSNTIFGQRYQMNTGYLYDQSYFNGYGLWHAGIDIGAEYNTPIKAMIGGTIAWVDGSADGYVFVGINSDDGRQWVYGHLKSNSGLSVNKRINAGDVIGLIGWYSGAPHLHLEVRTSNVGTGGASKDQNFLRNNTMSPLQAYWKWKNR
jgi:Peptidase family M23/FG-GAP-like repeat